MIQPHNYQKIAWEMEEHLETPVSKTLVELMPETDRVRFIKQNYLWTIGKISKEEIIVICKNYLDKAKSQIKKYKPKNDVEALFLAQKLK
jgi:hypothetical protein